MKLDELFEVEDCCTDCDEIMEEELPLTEAVFKGEKVTLNKPFKNKAGSRKKFSVYVKNKEGKVIKVQFGDPHMTIKRDDPKRRKAFLARHKCHEKKDKTTPAYWSCRSWSKKASWV